MNLKQLFGKIWYVRINVLSDFDFDSDGYIEFKIDELCFERRSKMFYKVLSDGVINEVGIRGYVGRNMVI